MEMCDLEQKSLHTHVPTAGTLICSIRFLDQLAKQKRLSYLNQVLVCFALFLYCYTKRKIEVRGREGKRRGEGKGIPLILRYCATRPAMCIQQ